MLRLPLKAVPASSVTENASKQSRRFLFFKLLYWASQPKGFPLFQKGGWGITFQPKSQNGSGLIALSNPKGRGLGLRVEPIVYHPFRNLKNRKSMFHFQSWKRQVNGYSISNSCFWESIFF